ncbi:MAG: translation initiation factor [Lentimicrobiaceae bacterium]|nr:translation initiation factor [Lentimicrobiaceae bacterium]
MQKHINKSNKDRDIVYSTNPDFRYIPDGNEAELKTLPPQQQDLRIMLDRKMKGGKKATLVTGFVGSEADLSHLAKQLKNLCAAGGSAAGGEILIQGDARQKIMEFLLKKGYKVKLSGG